MKKNIILYILLGFLIIVNGVFLFIFLNEPVKQSRRPGDFIAKQLKFDEKQLVQFDQLNVAHDKDRRMFADDTKQLKDALFNRISDENVTRETIDSLTSLLGEKERAREMMVFNHFRELRAICNEKQKLQLEKIIKDGLHKGRGENGRPPRKEGRRSPPPRH